MDSRRNRYDNRDSLELGDRAERLFTLIAQSLGWTVTPADSNADIMDHWDLLISKGPETYKVDVKAMKRMARSDASVQDEWFWVELHGVRAYDDGWLYGGKSDLIAIERSNSFLIVDRNNLIGLVHSLVDMKSRVYNSNEAKYRVYSRPGRPDRLALIETAKLSPIKWDEWAKP
jgi:hypothetical protein